MLTRRGEIPLAVLLSGVERSTYLVRRMLDSPLLDQPASQTRTQACLPACLPAYPPPYGQRKFAWKSAVRFAASPQFRTTGQEHLRG